MKEQKKTVTVKATVRAHAYLMAVDAGLLSERPDRISAFSAWWDSLLVAGIISEGKNTSKKPRMFGRK